MSHSNVNYSNNDTIVICHTALSGKGGMERLAIDLCGYLLRKKIRCTLAYTQNVGDHYPLPNKLLLKHIDSKNITLRDNDKKYSFAVVFNTNSETNKLIQYAQNIADKVIVSESATPYRILEHGHPKLDFLDASLAIHNSYKNVDAIRVELDYSKSAYCRIIQKKIFAFPNYSSIVKSEVKRTIGNLTDQYDILCVGGGKPNKNFMDLAKAISDLRESMDIELRVACPGFIPKSEYLNQIGAICNLNQIDFLGPVEDMAKLYDESLLHVTCSKDESFGLCIIEAASRGCPTIGNEAADGTRELINRYELGKTYNTKTNEYDLSQIIMELLNNFDSYSVLSNKCLEGSKNFSSDKYWNEWDSVFQYVANQNRSKS